MSARKQLFSFGRKRKADYVRGFREDVDGMSRVRVQWKELRVGRLKTESFPDTRKGIAEAKAFAEGVHERLQLRTPGAIEPITLRQLLEKHIAAKESEWRPNTLRLLRWRWGKLELHMGRNAPAHMVTREILDEVKRSLLASHAPNQVRMAIKAMTSVFRWGVDRDLIAPTKVVTYTAKFSKDAERAGPKMAEFSADERARVLAQLHPRDSRQWRAWVLTTLLAYCGPRQNAARHLEWSDVDFEAGLLRWRPEFDKMSSEREQPMPEPVREALWVAYGWRLAFGYVGPLVFFRPGAGTKHPNDQFRSPGHALARSTAKPDQPWGYAAFNGMLRQAETKAGIAHRKHRAAHGFRRGIAGDVHAATGSSKKAAEWIGDKSTKVVERHYLLERAEELRKTASLVSGTNINEPQRSAVLVPQDDPQPSIETLNREPAVGIEPTTARSQGEGM